MDSYPWMRPGWLPSENFDQFCVDIGSCLENLPGARDDMNDDEGKFGNAELPAR